MQPQQTCETRALHSVSPPAPLLFFSRLHFHNFRRRRRRFRFTVGQNNQEYRLKNWATCSSVPSFARTTHSFACFALITSLSRSAALICSLACSLTSELVEKCMIRCFKTSWLCPTVGRCGKEMSHVLFECGAGAGAGAVKAEQV